MKTFAGLVLISALIAVVPAKADEVLATAFGTARGATTKSRATATARESKVMLVRAVAASYVPADCSVESWCRVSATECFLGYTANPGGLWQGHAQYSVVLRAVAYCPTGYGKWEKRTFMSGVEPQQFTSAVETNREAASTGALNLCKSYREDWLAAAPVCAGN